MRDHVTPGRFMNDQNFQNLCLKVLYFCKILKSAKKFNKIRNFLFCFILYKEKMLTDKATIKGWKMDAKPPKSPVTYIWVTIKETVKFVNGGGVNINWLLFFKLTINCKTWWRWIGSCVNNICDWFHGYVFVCF